MIWYYFKYALIRQPEVDLKLNAAKNKIIALFTEHCSVSQTQKNIITLYIIKRSQVEEIQCTINNFSFARTLDELFPLLNIIEWLLFPIKGHLPGIINYGFNEMNIINGKHVEENTIQSLLCIRYNHKPKHCLIVFYNYTNTHTSNNIKQDSYSKSIYSNNLTFFKLYLQILSQYFIL